VKQNLGTYLRKAKDAYYAGEPFISDSQYDALEELYAKDTDIGTTRGQSPHLYKMYSLRKYYKNEDILPKGNYVITPKLDGAAIALMYVKGKFTRAVTRGNGEYGEDISHLFDETSLVKMGIPQGIDKEPEYAQIVGEVVAPKSIPNARNYAAGALSLKDINEFHNRELYFIPYGIQPNLSILYLMELKCFQDLGFNYIFDFDFVEQFPQDGLVYRVTRNDIFYDMGYTAKFPRGSFAVKERNQGIKTKLIDVIWQTGKSGKVTPVAILDPIEIDGAIVSRATLNNPGFIEALELEIGDFVMVERAGGIIPRIIKKAS